MSPPSDNHDFSAVPVLTASEIGEFEFCRQVWHLSRQGAIRSVAGRRRLISGAASHWSIGRKTDRLQMLERVRRSVLVVVVVAIVLLVIYAAGVLGVIRP